MLITINFILIFGALLGCYYQIAAGITWADFFCGFMVIALFLRQFFHKETKFDIIAKLTFVYVVWLGLVAIINGTLLQTQFLNYYRIFTEGLIMYVFAYNALDSKKTFRIFVYTFIVYCILFLITSRDMIALSMVKFDSFNKVDFGYGRNNWGFTNLMIIMLLSFFLYNIHLKAKLNLLCLALFPMLIFNIYFSASRFALIGCIAFFIFFRFWIKRAISPKEIILYVVIFVLAPTITGLLLNTIDSNILEQSQRIFEGKIDKTGEEGFQNRLMNLNFTLIGKYIDQSLFPELLVGNGLSVTHGIFSHTFIASGIIGFLYFCSYHLYLGIIFLKKRRAYSFAAFLIFIMFLNDIVTNSRFIIGVNNLMYMLILAVLINYSRLKISGKNESNIRCRA